MKASESIPTPTDTQIAQIVEAKLLGVRLAPTPFVMMHGQNQHGFASVFELRHHYGVPQKYSMQYDAQKCFEWDRQGLEYLCLGVQDSEEDYEKVRQELVVPMLMFAEAMHAGGCLSGDP